MDKKKAIKWLETFTYAHGIDPEERMLAAPVMANELGISSDEVLNLQVECEEKLIELFLEWYNETVDAAEDDKIPLLPSIKLTDEETFKLGIAYGSFSVGEIDQGLHIVLPCTDTVTSVEANVVFKPLFTKYFDRIPDDIPPEKVNAAYMGAVMIFAEEMGLAKNGSPHWAEVFREVTKDA